MSEETLQSAIKEVQDVLSKYLKKPPLSEKFLKKPPFRYLHDIVNALIQGTGFLEGLYSQEELDSNNVKDKDSKIAFLNKLVSAVKTLSGKGISARPAKIVAGLEVEKTLELLKIIGQCIDDNKLHPSKNSQADSEKAIKTEKEELKNDKKTLVKDDTNEKKTKENKKTRASISVSQTVAKTNDNESADVPIKRNSIKDNADEIHKINPTLKRESLKKRMSTVINNEVSSQKKELRNGAKTTNTSSTTKTVKEIRPSNRRPSIQNKATPGRKSSLKNSNRNFISDSTKNLESVIKEDQEEEAAISKKKTSTTSTKSKVPEQNNRVNTLTQNVLAKSENNVVEESSHKKTSSSEKENISATKSVPESNGNNKDEVARSRESNAVPRPSSARPGSRKLRSELVKNGTENVSTNEISKNKPEDQKTQIPIRPRTATRPPSARPGAPKVRDRGEVMVPEEKMATVTPVNVIEEGSRDQFADDKDSIILVESEQVSVQAEDNAQVIDVDQGQLVHQILKTQKELNDKVVTDNSQNKHLEIEWEAGRQREKDIISKEVEKIRSVIQVLTSAANPLGKLFDFLQEDVDEMQRELLHWKNTNEKLQKQQQIEIELNEQSLQPLRKQLLDIEANIQEEYTQIANIKTNILLNNETILKLVNGPTSHHQSKTRVK